MLGPVATVPAPGLPPGIVTLLQDKLLSLVLRVLEAYPAGGKRRKTLRDVTQCPGSVRDQLLLPGQGTETPWQVMGLSQMLGSLLAANVPFGSGTHLPRATSLPPTCALAW